MKTILNIWGGKHVDVFIANMNVVQDAWIYEYYHWRISKQLDECNSFEGDKSLSLIIELPIKSYLCLPNVFFSEHQQTRIIIFSTLWLYYQIHWILFIVLTWPYETCILYIIKTNKKCGSVFNSILNSCYLPKLNTFFWMVGG